MPIPFLSIDIAPMIPINMVQVVLNIFTSIALEPSIT
jgi:hypothetical protein